MRETSSLSLSESARKTPLRDKGLSDSSNPVAYMKREEPITPKRPALVTTKQTLAPRRRQEWAKLIDN